MDAVDVIHLRRCLELAREARDRGDEPFGSLLVGADGAVLAEERNAAATLQDVTAHPELMLVRWASQHLDAAQRAGATMYTSCEHCAMCAAGHHWAAIGRLVFALSGEQLIAMLPPGPPVLRLSSREVFARGSNPVVVDGPCPELEVEARALFDGVWA
jgi:tRNA(Arg) A34 adenosine deaminase TadA